MIKWVRSKLWIYFSFIVLIVTLIIALVTIAVLSTLEHFEIFAFLDSYPIWRWVLAILFSSLLGVLISMIVSIYILRPVSQLQRAMLKVTNRDFKLHLDEEQRVAEVKNLYAAFNVMVNELQSIEHFQRDFTSMVSHEFKTPLTRIQALSQVLQNDQLDNQLRLDYLESIQRACQQLTRMTDNLLKISRLDSQAISIEYQRFRLDEQIRQSLLFLQNLWESQDIQLDLQLEKVDYYGNRELLEQVWNNLLENAINYNQPAGSIYIHLSQDASRTQIIIEDSGIGIEAEHLPLLFDRFYQVDSSRNASGNGLGLAIVKRIIDLHQGQISYHKASPHGTRVIVTLPHINKQG